MRMFNNWELGNVPWPFDTGGLRRSVLNKHRINYLLAMGKVVLSEKSGIAEDENVYGGLSIFSLFL